ncbi:MAG: SWIM zinc finger family protein [Chloroflexaceae bacterium]|jgi:hypothetical protein|nr:SWIM zinc finger family protein [Chloroflexaceae bacterium]
MPTSLTSEQILALAPDDSSAKAGKSLANSRSWQNLGQNDTAAWGECQGSGKEPYRTQIDLSEPAFRCSCPSRKFPCKHGLGLLLLLAAQPAAFASAAPPAWVEDWLATRAKNAQRRSEKQAEAAQAETDPEVQKKQAARVAKSSSAREKKVAAGVAEASQWLRDQLRQGLATMPNRSPAAFDTLAARMVDAQAPGLARMLREMGSTPASGSGWQNRLLEQFASMHLLLEGYQRLASLSTEEQADVRTAVGFTLNQDELLAGTGQRDQWLVLGRREEDEDRLRVQRTWLWGTGSDQPALILKFSVGNQGLEVSHIPGTTLDAELVFFPSTVPLRALVKQLHAPPVALARFPAMPLEQSIARYAQALARNPWLERYPLALASMTPLRQGDGWLLRDHNGAALPLAADFGKTWELLALSGGHPLDVFGEWNGRTFLPLSLWAEGFVPL